MAKSRIESGFASKYAIHQRGTKSARNVLPNPSHDAVPRYTKPMELRKGESGGCKLKKATTKNKNSTVFVIKYFHLLDMGINRNE